MKKLPKTNACRLLDKAGIAYELVPYTVDPDDLSAPHIASQLGEDIASVYKTLVLTGDRTGYFVCVLPGDKEVDLKKAAQISGNKKAEMIPMKNLLSVTGYIRGGCTAIGLKKPFPVYLQQEAASLPFFYVSAGQRGLQLKLDPREYIGFTSATVGNFISE